MRPGGRTILLTHTSTDSNTMDCWGKNPPNPLFPKLAFCADSEIHDVILQRAKTSGMQDSYLKNSYLKTQVSRDKPTGSQAR